MTTCNSCGGCCDPVTLPYARNEVEAMRNAGRMDPDHAEWVLNVLEPMSPKEAKRIAPFLFEGKFRNAISLDGDIMTFYYRCTWFDRDTRQCTHYDERPTVCSLYPWVQGVPVGNEALPPMCSFRADLGQTPEDVPVSMTPNPRR